MNVRNLSYSLILAATRDKVWPFLSTESGLKSFFTPVMKVEFKPGGCFEMYFDPDADTGLKGSEGCKIMALETGKMLTFSWNAPPELPEVRRQKTFCSFYLSDRREGQTVLDFTHSGFGSSKDWQTCRQYFERAWGQIVLPRLKYAVEVNKINWNRVPELDSIPLISF